MCDSERRKCFKIFFFLLFIGALSKCSERDIKKLYRVENQIATTKYFFVFLLLTFKSSESNELIPLLDSLSMGEIGGCLSAGDSFDASESDSKNPNPSRSMFRAICGRRAKILDTVR